MKFYCKVSYETEFDVDECINEYMEQGYTKEQAMERFANYFDGNIIDPIDERADNKFYTPYTRMLKHEWRKE